LTIAPKDELIQEGETRHKKRGQPRRKERQGLTATILKIDRRRKTMLLQGRTEAMSI
jgi:hypothetical protein